MEYEDQDEAEFAMHAAASYDDRVKARQEEEAASASAAAAAEAEETPPPTTVSRNKGTYKECLKNHAVGLGGHALDGCGEFIPAGAEGSLESFKCAACNCHRNFHRKESPPPQQRHQPPQLAPLAPPGYLQQRGGGAGVAATLALPSTSGARGGTHSPRAYRDLEDVSEPTSGGSGGGGGGGGGSNHNNNNHKKRFRTKFTQDQKDKMLAFAEKLGWRIQKHDETLVQDFCSQTGVQRQVLKVWMHNNKHTLATIPSWNLNVEAAESPRSMSDKSGNATSSNLSS